jgi:hypothetical protein
MVTPLNVPATAVAEQADITNTNEDSSNTRLSPRLGDEPVTDAPTSVIPPAVITVRQTPFTTNPKYAYEAVFRNDVPGGVEGYSKCGATPWEAVDRLMKARADLFASALIKWSDGTESIIDDGVIFDVINDRRLIIQYFSDIHNAIAPPPLLEDGRAAALVQRLFDEMAVLVNRYAEEAAKLEI